MDVDSTKPSPASRAVLGARECFFFTSDPNDEESRFGSVCEHPGGSGEVRDTLVPVRESLPLSRKKKTMRVAAVSKGC